MERLLRGCMQVGDVPDAEDCLRNWWAFRDAGLEAQHEPDAKIIAYFETFYGSMQAAPDVTVIRQFFEMKDEIDVVDRLEEIRRAQPYIRSNYRAICNMQREEQERKRVVRVLNDARNIVEHGRNLDKPIGEKKVLRGVGDALAYLYDKLPSFSRHDDDVTAADALQAYVSFRAAPRILTGIPAIDTSFDGGGLPTPRLIVFGGAPGAGKTSVCTAIAHEAMKQGHAVAFLAIDEGLEGVAGRLCKIEGLKEPKAPPPNEFAAGFLLRVVPKPRRDEIAATSKIAGLPFFINETASVEQMVDRLLRFAEVRSLTSKAPVLVVDSIQKVRARGSSNAPDPRMRVDAVTSALKEAVRRGVLVLATSELNRSAYRSKKVDEQTADIAAAKESGAIEYAAQTLFILRSTQDEDVINVTTPKNRGGKHPSFRLRLDRERMSYAQIEDEAEGTSQSRLTADAEVLKEIVRTHPGIRTVRELRAACQAGGQLTKHERIDAARSYLELHRLLTRADGAFVVAAERTTEEMIA